MSEIPLSEKLQIAAESSMLNAATGATTTTVDNLARQAHLFEAAAQVCKAAEDWHAGQREAIEADRIGQTSPEFDARWSAAYRKIAKAEQALLAAVDAAVLAGGTPR